MHIYDVTSFKAEEDSIIYALKLVCQNKTYSIDSVILFGLSSDLTFLLLLLIPVLRRTQTRDYNKAIVMHDWEGQERGQFGIDRNSSR